MRMVTNTYKTLRNIPTMALMLVLGLFASNTAIGQDCPMVCNNLIQVSVDSDCSATITPDMVLEGVDMEIEDMTCEFLIVLYDEDGDEFDRSTFAGSSIAGFTTTFPTVGNQYIGQTIEVGIWADSDINGLVDMDTANNCWSNAAIEDKIPNALVCPTDAVEIPCYEELSIAELMGAETSQDFSGSDVTITGMATTNVTVSVINTADQFELINTVTVDFTTMAADADLSVTLTSPDGADVAVAQMPTMGSVIFNDFFGTQATDAYLNGDWTLTITYSGADATTDVSDVEVTFDSQSALSMTFDTDNCEDGEIAIISDVTFDYDCRDETEPYTMRRLITYGSEDGAQCILTINFVKASLGDIESPDNITVSCGDDSNNDGFFDDIFLIYDDNDNGILEPSETGVPTIDGSPIFPMDQDNACKFNVAVADQLFETCASNFKIIRTFTVYDWCNAEVLEVIQTIEQVDDVAPVLACPGLQSIEVDSDASGCFATFTLDPLGVNGDDGLSVLDFLFDCSDEYEVMAVGYKEANEDGTEPDAGAPFEFDENIINNGNGTYTLVDLEGPRVWIQYIIADGCGNVITFPVADSSNQTATCFLEVDIIDTTPPVAICDEFTVVALSESGWGRVYAESLDDGSYDYCGDVTFQVRRTVESDCTDQTLSADGFDDLEFDDFIQVCCADLGTEVMVELLVTDEEGNTSSCMVTVIAQDKSDPVVVSCPGNFTLDCDDTFVLNDPNASGPTLDDNCGFGNVVPRDTDNRDDCGAGTVTRSWFMVGADGTQTSLNCNQTITFNLVTISESDIVYPSDLAGSSAVQGCMQDATDPSDTGFPTYRGGVLIEDAPGCGDIAVTYNDQVFSDVADACFKILRTWTIIDWCIYDTTDPFGAGYYTGFQTIMLNNDDAPVFTTCGTDATEYCMPADVCEMTISYSAAANDGCTGSMISEASRYTYVLSTSTGTVIESGTGLSGSTSLPYGSYRISWTVVGACDIAETCSSTFSVDDCLAPNPYCKGGITTVILPDALTVEIWASDLDLASTDQCDNDVTFTFEDGSSNMEFGCDDVGDNEVIIVVTDPSGNSDFCATTVTIQANNGACGSASRVAIAGNIMTEAAEGIMDVEVSLEHMSDLSMDYDMSLEDGNYTFDDILSLEDYHLTADKQGDARNGVSTLDIILIQRHLLNIESLDSAYKMIAADANNSQSVTAADMVDIRKLVLEIYDEFPSNKSWRFVDSAEQYADINNPWPLQEDILISNLLADEMAVNWTGIKVGDVNGSATLNLATGNTSETRGSGAMNLSVEMDDAGNYIISTIEAIDLTGFQMELNMTDVQSVSSDILNLRAEHYSIDQQGLGISYSQLNTEMIPAGAVLLTINADTDSAITLGESISAEAYNGDLEILAITLNAVTTAEVSGLTLHQNVPNPFAESTQIAFDLPKAGSATLEIMDINGRVMYSITQQLSAGRNTQTIDANLLPTGGLVYYRLNFEGDVQTKKMILLD